MDGKGSEKGGELGLGSKTGVREKFELSSGL